MQNRWIHSGAVIMGNERGTQRSSCVRLNGDGAAATSASAPSRSPGCQERRCTTGAACVPYGQKCATAKDCKADSCCVVLDLDVMNSNLAARLVPEAFIAPCGSTSKLYCDEVCKRTEPDWIGNLE